MDYSIGVIARNVRELRECLGLDRAGFALLAGISVDLLCTIESGRRVFSMRHLERVCLLTGVSMVAIRRTDLVLPVGLRRKILRRYRFEVGIAALFSAPPTVVHVLRFHLVKGAFMQRPRTLEEIRRYLLRMRMDYSLAQLERGLSEVSDICGLRCGNGVEGSERVWQLEGRLVEV